MADRLYVSYWLRGFTGRNMLRHFERMLRAFPLLPRSPGASTLRIQAISFDEPPLLERALNDPLDVAEVLAAARELSDADTACEIDTWWGLWQFDSEWALRPARVTLSCFGPSFDAGSAGIEGQEHLRIDFGLDSHFLPDPAQPAAHGHIQSNIRGLLRLVHTLDDVLQADRRMLWTESGENFSEKLRSLTMAGG